MTTVFNELYATVARVVGDGNLGGVVRQMMADDPSVTAAEIVAVWRAAEEDYAADRAADRAKS